MLCHTLRNLPYQKWCPHTPRYNTFWFHMNYHAPHSSTHCPPHMRHYTHDNQYRIESYTSPMTYCTSPCHSTHRTSCHDFHSSTYCGSHTCYCTHDTRCHICSTCMCRWNIMPCHWHTNTRSHASRSLKHCPPHTCYCTHDTRCCTNSTHMCRWNMRLCH